MNWDALAALTAFAFAGTWTPGPNNVMLANSGASFGFRATAPHALGVALGFPVMVFCLALGLGQAFQAEPLLRTVLHWAGAALLFYIAWRIGTAGRARAGETAKPFSFTQAVAFQWVNPKAWTMVIGATSAYATGAHPVAEAALCAGPFLLSGMTSAFAWAGLGVGIRRALSTDARLRAFNICMGLLVAASAIALLLEDPG